MAKAKKIETTTIEEVWIKPCLLYPTFGITTEAARKYRVRYQWLEGVHYKRNPLGRYTYNRRAINDWQQGRT